MKRILAVIFSLVIFANFSFAIGVEKSSSNASEAAHKVSLEKIEKTQTNNNTIVKAKTFKKFVVDKAQKLKRAFSKYFIMGLILLLLGVFLIIGLFNPTTLGYVLIISGVVLILVSVL